jgi:HTH-type transcriptional regulator/antitoxin HigA
MEEVSMSALSHDDDDEYLALVRRFPLRPIRTDEENDRAAEMCDTLTDHIDDLSTAEKDYLDVLTDLILKYESKWDDEDGPLLPRELLALVMQENQLVPDDLVAELGTVEAVTAFLAGERELSEDQADRLAKRFCLSISAFIDLCKTAK